MNKIYSYIVYVQDKETGYSTIKEVFKPEIIETKKKEKFLVFWTEELTEYTSNTDDRELRIKARQVANDLYNLDQYASVSIVKQGFMESKFDYSHTALIWKNGNWL